MRRCEKLAERRGDPCGSSQAVISSRPPQVVASMESRSAGPRQNVARAQIYGGRSLAFRCLRPYRDRSWHRRVIGASGLFAALVLFFAFAQTATAFVYWTNRNGGAGTTLGRANLDGTGADETFIGGATGPVGIAVDAAHIYWANAFGAHSTIGRANLNGTEASQSFISGAPTLAESRSTANTSTGATTNRARSGGRSSTAKNPTRASSVELRNRLGSR